MGDMRKMQAQGHHVFKKFYLFHALMQDFKLLITHFDGEV